MSFSVQLGFIDIKKNYRKPNIYRTLNFLELDNIYFLLEKQNCRNLKNYLLYYQGSG